MALSSAIKTSGIGEPVRGICGCICGYRFAMSIPAKGSGVTVSPVVAPLIPSVAYCRIALGNSSTCCLTTCFLIDSKEFLFYILQVVDLAAISFQIKRLDGCVIPGIFGGGQTS
jgi:hypothetical protein